MIQITLCDMCRGLFESTWRCTTKNASIFAKCLSKICYKLWHKHITNICQMFDKDLHPAYLLCGGTDTLNTFVFSMSCADTKR